MMSALRGDESSLEVEMSEMGARVNFSARSAQEESYLALVATNPRRGSVWGGQTITELQVCQRRLAVAIAWREADSVLGELDHDVLVRTCHGALRGVICFGLESAGPPSVESCRLTETVCRKKERLGRRSWGRDCLVTGESKLLKLPSRWSRWTTFGHKGTWRGHHAAPPSAETVGRVMAKLQTPAMQAEAQHSLSQYDPQMDSTEPHARYFNRLHEHSLARRPGKVKLRHAHRFLTAKAADEKVCLKTMLRGGFHESVHQNIDDAVDGVSEFSPEMVMEHLESESHEGWFTTATTHTLCLKLREDAQDQINMAEHEEQVRAVKANLSQRGFQRSLSSDAITLESSGDQRGLSAVMNPQTVCQTECAALQFSSAATGPIRDEISLCCEVLIHNSLAGEIYFGLGPVGYTGSFKDGRREHSPSSIPLNGTIYNRCAHWLGVRLANGAIWSGTDGTPAGNREQLLGDQNWMQDVGAALANDSSAMVDGTPDSSHPHFAKTGDRVRLEIRRGEPDTLIVSKNGEEQGKLPLPQLTRVALNGKGKSLSGHGFGAGLRWVVTMSHPGDAVHISFPRINFPLPPPAIDRGAAQSRPIDAGISYRRLLRRHIEAREITQSEVIYEVLFLASAPELKRLGCGTLLVDQLKHLLANDQGLGEGSVNCPGVTPPVVVKRSLCVSIKSESPEALQFWAAMGLSPADKEDPNEKVLIDLMVPFADFTPIAATWAIGRD